MVVTANVTAGVELSSEFERQVENLLGKGYPGLASQPEATFRDALAPLAGRLADLSEPATTGTATTGAVPFVLVVRSTLVPTELAVPRVELRGKAGFTDMDPTDLARFSPVDGVALPGGWAYLATGVDTGPDTLDVTPDDALPVILGRGRSPLTIDEGVALVTHYPEILADANCFSMLGSRCGDRRVTALWLSKRRPRLGWCWAGNPHTWLGSASCGARLGSA